MAATLTLRHGQRVRFDYLRDNGMATRKEDQVQRDYGSASSDEIDSILVDEARTPLIISGPRQSSVSSRLRDSAPGRSARQRSGAPLQQDRHRGKGVARKARRLRRRPPARRAQDAAGENGHPKNKQLLRLMENGQWRKLLDKVETDMNSDLNKDELYKSRKSSTS